MKRIGLYGGSFDPPHNAHLALARLARDQLALDELRIVPAGRPWQKPGRQVATPAQRAEMAALAFGGEPRMRLERHEIDHDGPSYTVDTLAALQQGADGAGTWFLVIGQDQYARLDTWHDWRRLLTMATLAVAAREGRPVEAGKALAAEPHQRVELALPDMPISSTDLRARLARGESVAGLVPPAVAGYIDRTHLYRS